MFGIDNYPGFVLAAIVLNLTPGLDTIYILTRSVSQGKAAGLASVAGIMSGCLFHVLFAAFGLSLILSTSARVFAAVKWAGAIYLVFLGIRMIATRPSFLENLKGNGATRGDIARIYRQGVLTNVLNPKVALFFMSFLPQFIQPAQPYGPLPFLILGASFLVTGTLWCLALTFFAARMTHALRHHPATGHWLHKCSGMIFIGFGLKIALTRSA